MKKTLSAHVYNTIERYPQILKTPKVEKAMGNLKCWMALRVNRGFDNSSYIQITGMIWSDCDVLQAARRELILKYLCPGCSQVQDCNGNLNDHKLRNPDPDSPGFKY